MLIALLAALVAVITAFLVTLDRRDKRHDAQLTRLLVHVQAPERAVAHATSVVSDGPLYVPPEDDQAWNKHHGIGSD